jgi:predicted RNA-binding protein with RPS1 domain
VAWCSAYSGSVDGAIVADTPQLNDYLSQPLRDWLSQPVADTTDPDLLTVASLLCTPPIVPYRLLRRMRRNVLSRPGTLGLEGVLCSAWFVESLAGDGFVFEADFTRLMRDRLREGIVARGFAADLIGLRGILEEGTAELSPLLRLEERLCWAYSSEADFSTTVDTILTDVVYTIVEEERTRILTWVAGAFSRLPPEIIAGPAAWLLAQLCDAAKLPHPPVEWPPGGVDGGLLRDALALVPDTLTGFRRDGETLMFGRLTPSRRFALPLPAVTPKFVNIKWDSNTSQVWIDTSSHITRVPVGRSSVELRDMRGRLYRLEAFTGDRAPEDEALDHALAELERRWHEQQSTYATVRRLVPNGKGLIVSFDEFTGVTAFMPTSKTGITPFSFKKLQNMIDSRIPVRIINFDQQTLSIVVTRSSNNWTSGTLAVGDEFTGRVTSKTNFGVFVSFAEAAGIRHEDIVGNKTDGLVHKTELSWIHDYTKKEEFPVEVGDMMRVRVLEIDAQRQRVSLSARQTQPDPWQMLMSSIHVGDRLTVPVTGVMPYGWFLRLSEGIEGLLHISEAPEGSIFQVGEEITVWVLDIDDPRRRVSLTMRPAPR